MIIRLHIVFVVGFLLIIQAPSSAQGPTNHWYFGEGLHFSFDEYPPIVDYFPHRLDFSHSTMSDSSGNFLFYSGNQGVYNKHHQIMINGDDVPKKNSGKRSVFSIIVPNPGHENQYYVIRTIGGFWPDDYHDLHYALVDMTGDDGNGEVLVKNMSLGTDFGREMVAVHHYNEKDIWVIVKHRFENTLFAYLITSSGISTPVLSHFESNIALSVSYPSLKISPLGDLLAITTGREMLIFSFDNETGIINKIFDTEPFLYQGGGDVEFSADGSKLIQLFNYCKELHIRQYDLDYATFQESWDNVYVEKVRLKRLRGRMQLAIDGNIYVSPSRTSCGSGFGPGYSDFYNMDVIMNAGAQGNFKYTRNYFTLEKPGVDSPPRFVASYLRSRDPLITWKDPCDGDSVRFRLLYGYYFEQLHWDFGYGTTYTGPQSAVKKKYDAPGDYTVKVKITRPDEVLTTEKLIRIKPSPHTGLVSQYIMCGEDPVALSVQDNPEISWSNGSIVPNATYQQPGKFWVSVTDDGCVTTDTFQIEQTAYPVSLLPDSVYTCDTLPVQLRASNNNAYSFLWSTGSNANPIEVHQDGKYWVQMTDNTCTTRDTVKVIYADIPEVTISVEEDSLVHEQGLIASVSHTDKMDYWIWDFGDGNNSWKLNPRHKYRYSGNYQVSFEGRNRYGCRISDTINVFMQQYIFIPNVFTPNNDGYNDYFSVKLNFDSSIKLRVMNRWGSPVYASDDYDNFWEAENVKSGVYFYDIELPDVKQRYSGTLHILR